MDNPDINKYPIDFLSESWSVTVAFCVLLIFSILFIGKRISNDKKELYAKFLSFLINLRASLFTNSNLALPYSLVFDFVTLQLLFFAIN